MPIVVEGLAEAEIPSTLLRLRAHAATVRTLLDELERARPSADRLSKRDLHPSLAGQLAEELARLGCRMLECASVVTLLAAQLARGQA